MPRARATSTLRTRRYRSCGNCRKAKAKCEGLEDSYLRSLNDPSFAPPSPRPRCRRCIYKDLICIFDPLRRKGRPPKESDDHSSPCSPVRPVTNAPQQALPSTDTPLSVSPSPLPPPSASVPERPTSPGSESLQVSSKRSAQCSDTTPDARQSQLSEEINNRFVVSALEWIAKAYLTEIFPWSPLLDPNARQLESYLARCHPLLLVAINCTVDPSLAPPPFPLSIPQISLSLLQSAALFAVQAFGTCLFSRALLLDEWALNQVRRLGWNGCNETEISSAVDQSERQAFVACGWEIFSFTTSLGVLTGHRNVLVKVELPEEVSAVLHSRTTPSLTSRLDQVTPRNCHQQALDLFRHATDYERIQDLSLDDQYVFCDWIIGQSETIRQLAEEHLVATLRAARHSVPPSDAHSIVLGAAREQLFEAAILSATSTILILSSGSRRPNPVFRGLRFDLSNLEDLTDSTLASIARASNQILAICKTATDCRGNLLAFEPHSPTWVSSILVASYGLLVQAYTTQRKSSLEVTPSVESPEGGGGGRAYAPSDVSGIASRQLDEDLDFFTLVLSRQGKWSVAESCRVEVLRMREAFDRFVRISQQ